MSFYDSYMCEGMNLNAVEEAFKNSTPINIAFLNKAELKKVAGHLIDCVDAEEKGIVMSEFWKFDLFKKNAIYKSERGELELNYKVGCVNADIYIQPSDITKNTITNKPHPSEEIMDIMKEFGVKFEELVLDKTLGGLETGNLGDNKYFALTKRLVVTENGFFFERIDDDTFKQIDRSLYCPVPILNNTPKYLVENLVLKLDNIKVKDSLINVINRTIDGEPYKYFDRKNTISMTEFYTLAPEDIITQLDENGAVSSIIYMDGKFMFLDKKNVVINNVEDDALLKIGKATRYEADNYLTIDEVLK